MPGEGTGFLPPRWGLNRTRRRAGRLPVAWAPDSAEDGAVDDGQEPPGGFCVVANAAAETARGEGGLDLSRGVRHFAAGAKVWVLPPQWATAVIS